ncbi:MAG TPA: hypothetical protein VKV73_27705, partial [Chloroflexota bacterium]|nr:hypothetical protein [Chloroflexota bacterium]
MVEAIARSSLGHLPRELIGRLFDGALIRTVAAGTSTHREGDLNRPEIFGGSSAWNHAARAAS